MVKRLALGALALLVVLFGIAATMAYEPDIPRSLLEAKYAVPPSRFVTLPDGTHVHYRDRGPRNAPILLLLHGSDSSLLDWEGWSKDLSRPIPEESGNAPMPVAPPKASVEFDKREPTTTSSVLLDLQMEPGVDRRKVIAEAIARVQAYLTGFHIISVDLPGHGLTGATVKGDYSEQAMADFVGAFADKLGIREFALAGNSMGGGVAARFAEQHPNRVSQLILVDAHAEGVGTAGRLPLAYRLARTPVLNRLLLKLTPRFVVEEALNKVVANKVLLTDDFIDRFWDFLRMEGTRSATLARFNLKPDTYVRDHLKKITAPTLILWGADDRLLPVDDARVWAKGIANSELIIYPATGHLPMEELPEKSAADVRAFLEPHIHYEIRVNNAP
jgi:pimeloyl-ACP methyl ester carboxylesterase